MNKNIFPKLLTNKEILEQRLKEEEQKQKSGYYTLVAKITELTTKTLEFIDVESKKIQEEIPRAVLRDKAKFFSFLSKESELLTKKLSALKIFREKILEFRDQKIKWRDGSIHNFADKIESYLDEKFIIENFKEKLTLLFEPFLSHFKWIENYIIKKTVGVAHKK